MERVICIAIGYLFGLLQTGFFYGKAHKIDIRTQGSGNSGTTNAIRTLGWKAGIITFIGDCFKCIFAVLIVKIIYAECMPDALPLLGLYAGLGAVLGHNFPFYLNFKGGKGVATSVGLALSTNIVVALVAIATFYVVMKTTKYVSVGSMSLLAVFATGTIIYDRCVGFGLPTAGMQYELYAVVVFLFIMSVIRHRENIKRLKNGTENKIKGKKK
ncbi:MAG: glycerol-3-phosphate 1-O-acyltransferase PlsY [Eubacteriales bacterium]